MGRRTPPNSEIAKQAQNRKPPKDKEAGPRLFLSTGSTLRNLALSDFPDKGLLAGSTVHIIGDSNAGKTLDALTILTEAANNPEFDNHELINDDVEQKNEFDIKSLFGSKAAERIQPPARNKDGAPQYSNTIQDFEVQINKRFRVGKPFVYLLDSWDAITSEDDEEYYLKKLDAYEKNKEIKGSYGMSKPKQASEMLRQIKSKIRETASILIIISQTRDNIDPMTSHLNPRRYTGGRALEFYPMYRWWIAMIETVKDNKFKDRKIGARTRHKITKNHCTGKERVVEGAYYNGYGIDDIGSMVDWLISKFSGNGKDKGYWVKETGGYIVVPEWDVRMQRAELIKYIEENNKHRHLKRITHKAWSDIEAQVQVDRRPRYA